MKQASSHLSLFQEKSLCPLISTTPKRPTPNELKIFITPTSPLHILTHVSPSNLLSSLPTSIKGLYPLPSSTLVLFLCPELEVLGTDTAGAEQWDVLAGAGF